MPKRDWSLIETVPLMPGAVRDEAWLMQLLDATWDEWFADVEQANDVRIVFGRRAKRRLGSISLDPGDRTTSIITMNSVFKRTDIPEFIILATLVHELTHYAHGFNSPLDRAQQHPHAGGVIRREYADRGLLDLYVQQKAWLRARWPAIVSSEFGAPVREATRSGQVISVPRPFWVRK